jgi:hypothetical protein
MIAVDFRSRELEMKLARLADAARVDYGSVIREEAGYVTKLLIQFTPPKSLSEGRNAISGDMNRLSVPLKYEYFKSRVTEGGFYKSISRYVRTRQTEKLNQLFQNPNLKHWYGMHLFNSVDQLAAEHKKKRNIRGRIPSKTNFASYSGDFKALRNEIQSRVGWTASGWIPSARVTGVRYKKFSDRFKGKSGSVQYNFGRNPFIVGRNLNVKIPNYQRTVDAVLRSRIATTEIKLERVLAGKAINLGFMRVKERPMKVNPLIGLHESGTGVKFILSK